MHLSRRALALVAALALGACRNSGDTPMETPADAVRSAMPGVQAELAAARAATAKYHDVAAAVADGYQDIEVFMPGMGHHYLNPALLDGEFDPRRPELLVYADHGGRRRLVAVEYAVPLALAAEAPAGFSGAEDVWNRNETFQLWTLHAWTWLENPDGVFASHNPRLY